MKAKNAIYRIARIKVYVWCPVCRSEMINPRDPKEWDLPDLAEITTREFECPHCDNPVKLPAKLIQIAAGL